MNGLVKQFIDLPENIQNFLLSPAGFAWANNVETKFKLTKGKATILLKIVEKIVLDIATLEFLPSIILSKLEVDWDTACQIAVELAGNRLLPLKNFLQVDIEAQIRDWGGEPEKFLQAISEDLVATEKPEDIIGRTLFELNIKFSDPLLEKRLVFILNAYLTNQRSEAETKSVLMRSPKVGGMELKEKEAEQLLTTFRGKRIVQSKVMTDIVKPVTATPVAAHQVLVEIPVQTPVLPAVPQPHPSPLLGKEREILDDAKDIATASVILKEKILPAAKPVTSVEDAVKRIEVETGLVLDENARKKFLATIEARLKEVRDVFETRDVLERSTEQGGSGLKGILLTNVIESLEKIVSEWQMTMMTEVNNTRQVAREAKAVEVAEKKQAAIVAAKAARPKVVLPPMAPVMSSASQTAAVSRPVMTDVVSPARKLSGPIDELARLTPDEFRRLSRDPHEAVIKIKDKIGLLEEQGIGQKILGVKAWRSSPVNTLYLEINRQALLSGRMVEVICNEREKNNQVFLTPEEIKAINVLNGELRF